MLRKSLMILSFLSLSETGASAQTRAQTCYDLWLARNEIYKAQGYCFRTQRAIATFGNAGCQYDNIEDVPLSANDRRRIDDILRQERNLRCPR